MFEICNMHISCIFQVRAFSIGEEESYSRDIGNLFPAATGEASSRGFCVSFVIREILGWYRGPAWRGFRSFKILSFLSGKTVGTCAVSRQDCWQDVQPSHDRYKQIKDCAAGWSRGILVKWLTRRNAKSGMHYPSYPSRDALMIGCRGTDFGYRLCEENSIFRFPFSVPPRDRPYSAARSPRDPHVPTAFLPMGQTDRSGLPLNGAFIKPLGSLKGREDRISRLPDCCVTHSPPFSFPLSFPPAPLPLPLPLALAPIPFL